MEENIVSDLLDLRPKPKRAKRSNSTAHTYDALIDAMIERPGARLGELAKVIKRTPGWVSQIVHSDSFKARFEARRAMLNEEISDAVATRIGRAAISSLDILLDRLENNPQALKTMQVADIVQKTTTQMGFGASKAPLVQVNNAAVAAPIVVSP